ncbi:uncharacterized protein LOC131940073 [Physella acuta]|uniref:uncharacterized protein LOC131940073 n=1 Tax=Physella acuta TaxID=109671 RepID=UPI0027DB8513|nr:uncharacterized protein LOC131940073 [Physella acuta]
MKLALLTVAILFALSEGKSLKRTLKCHHFGGDTPPAAGKRDIFCIDLDQYGHAAAGKRFTPYQPPADGLPPPPPPPPPPADGALFPPPPPPADGAPPPPPPPPPTPAQRDLDCDYVGTPAVGRRDIYCYDSDDYGSAVVGKRHLLPTRYFPSD